MNGINRVNVDRVAFEPELSKVLATFRQARGQQ
jgi:hypothetical protein